MRHELSDLVAASDIAKRLNVSRPAVSNWHLRDELFPDPLIRVAGGTTPLWSWREVVTWHRNDHRPSGRPRSKPE